MKQILEQLIREGKHKEAERLLLKLNLSKVPRQEALAIANVARRINRPEWALRILNPIVRDSRRMDGEATAAEKIEYANSLRKLGAISESSQILQQIDVTQHPQVDLHLALCRFAEWKYIDAIPMLRRYVDSLTVNSYAWIVGQVNLASALITVEEFSEAASLLEETTSAARALSASLLDANCSELKAQIEILHHKNWARALDTLADARLSLAGDGSANYNLFVDKWVAIALSLQEGKVRQELLDVRKKALDLQHWETLRDCELYIAQLSNDSHKLLELYFGTPHSSFRSRIEKSSPDLMIPESYLWCSGKAVRPGLVFDLATATVDGRDSSFAVGQLPHQLVILLARDFYRPLPLLSVFSGLHPDEYFSPMTSANRVHQLVRRSRQIFQEEGWPLSLEEKNGTYRLEFGSQSASTFAIRVPREPLPLAAFELELGKLRSFIATETFSNREAVSALGTSRASIQRLLKWAMDEGKIAATAGGRSAKYKFVS